jgi:hypothetical protein
LPAASAWDGRPFIAFLVRVDLVGWSHANALGMSARLLVSFPRQKEINNEKDADCPRRHSSAGVISSVDGKCIPDLSHLAVQE